jgi:hypothetical protein
MGVILSTKNGAFESPARHGERRKEKARSVALCASRSCDFRKLPEVVPSLITQPESLVNRNFRISRFLVFLGARRVACT